MKNKWICVVFLTVFTACNNSSGFENKADSLSRKIDSFGKKVVDSTKKGAKELKDRIEDKFEKKDSADK